jgi:hypothetical protein
MASGSIVAAALAESGFILPLASRFQSFSQATHEVVIPAQRP